MIALIDCDIIVYRVGFKCEEEDNEAYVQGSVRNFVTDLLLNIPEVDGHGYECFLSGASSDNFRHDYAVTLPYKGNRKGAKPKWYDAIREYLVDYFDASVSSGQEADDDIAMRATELGAGNCIMCSIDKDFLQIEGEHYNFVKNERTTITKEEGLLNFYCQFLEGDRIDNIQGVDGIGKVKARKMLTDLSAKEMYELCAEKLDSHDRAIENGILLFLRRKANQIWRPPK